MLSFVERTTATTRHGIPTSGLTLLLPLARPFIHPCVVLKPASQLARQFSRFVTNGTTAAFPTTNWWCLAVGSNFRTEETSINAERRLITPDRSRLLDDDFALFYFRLRLYFAAAFSCVRLAASGKNGQSLRLKLAEVIGATGPNAFYGNKLFPAYVRSLPSEATLKDSQGLSVRPFRENSPRCCIALPAIFNISKLAPVARARKREGRWRFESKGGRKQRENAGKTAAGVVRVAPYQKLKFHSAKPWRYRDPLRGCDSLSVREIPEARYRNGVLGVRGSKP